MSANKRIDNRLDQLFTEIDKEKISAQENKPAAEHKPVKRGQPSRASKGPKTVTNAPAKSSAENVQVETLQTVDLLTVPFKIDEQNWATLQVASNEAGQAWDEEQKLLVEQVATQLSLALENARLFQETQRRALEMTALAEVSREISATLELQSVLERISLRAHEILNAITTAVYVPDTQFKTLTAITAIGVEADEIKNDPLQFGSGILGTIANNKVGEIVNDVYNDRRAITIQGTSDATDEHIMAAPILLQDNLSGLLVVWRVGPKELFTETEFEFLLSLAQQAAIAVENARLFDETIQRTEELAAINEIIASANQSLELKATLTTVLEKVLASTGFDGGLITMFNTARGKLERAVRIGLPGKSPADPAQGLENSLCNYVFRTGKPMVNGDISKGVPEGIDVSSDVKAGLRGYIGIPIQTKGRVLGTLCIFRYLNEFIPENTFNLVQTIGGQLGFTIDNALLFDQTQERAEELTILNEMARELSSEMNITRISETAYHYVNRLVDSTNFFIAIYDEQTSQITMPIVVNEGQRINAAPRRLGNGLTDYVIRNKTPLYIPENVPERMRELGLEVITIGNDKMALSWLGVPYVVGNRVVGAMVVQSVETANLYSEHDRDLLLTVSSQVAIALENARLFRDAQSRARREKLLREITARVRATTDPEMIAKIAVREVGQALGVSSYIQIENSEENLHKNKPSQTGEQTAQKKSATKRRNSQKGGK